MTYVPTQHRPNSNLQKASTEMVRKESDWVSAISVTGSIRRRRQQVGFDRFNDLFESALRSEAASTTYPPHNVEKHGDDHYRIVIAAAGLTEEDLDIQVEKEVLTITGGKRESDKEAIYLHQGIAQRAFRLSFRLADHIEVQNASLSNGLLSIDLLRVVPEEAKPRRINIDGSGKSDLKQIN
ncbi:Hsp20 family protein [Pseudomonas baetica]|uniref:Hsp20 family protein n=1 Tax=Pseudomonas baetica TaxID=674054 RepID=UPI002405FBBC|nr:Hsp20 family protein [Pseudomonas baetica]MDF9773327.1 molecular chaperone IbpA [Pseudomonas baetica]